MDDLKIFIDSMRRRGLNAAVFLVVAAMALAVICAGCGKEETAAGKMKVAADIVPLADFCREVGGDAVEVETLVPPGASPHAYELTSGQTAFLEEARVVVANGLDLSPWVEGVLEKVAGGDAVTVIAADAVPAEELIEATGHGGEDAGGREIYDPHIWLDPRLAMEVVEAIRDGLSRADPVNAAAYRDNAGRYLAELARLDEEIGEASASFSSRRFIAFHSTWTYFARRYGLDQVAVIEELPGKEPSAGEIAGLVDTVEAGGIKVIFAEAQFSPRAAEAIAEESGGEIEVLVLDPLGDPGDPGSDTYLEMMRKNVRIMEEALG